MAKVKYNLQEMVKMVTLAKMVKFYNSYAFTHNYLIAFNWKKMVIVAYVNGSDLENITTLDKASRGAGNALRFKPNMAQKNWLMENCETFVLCSAPAPAQEPAALEEPPAELTHWWKYTFKNDKCEFKCSPTKITIKRKLRDGWKTSTIRKGSARSDLYEGLGIAVYSYEHKDLDERLGVAVKVMLYAGYGRIEYEGFKPNRENILHLTECLDGVFGVPADYWKPTEAGCLGKVKSLIKKRINDNDYGSIVLKDVTLSGKTLNVNVEFYKKAYGDSYDRNYYGRWTFDDLSAYGSRRSTEFPENAWWDGTTARDTPSGPVQRVVFFSDDADKRGATPNYFAMIADEICITEYLSAD